eukprot:scaffold144690_cov24-Tisochrysis_lutea.AAC.1
MSVHSNRCIPNINQHSENKGQFWVGPAQLTMGPATDSIFSRPYNWLTRESANSKAVPGPRLV